MAVSGEVITVYRVEGLPNTRVLIGQYGDVAIIGDQTLFVNFGNNAEARRYFAKKLAGRLPGAELKSFQVPKSFYDDLLKDAVDESLAKQFPDRPFIVHQSITKKPDQLGLRPKQVESLRRAIIQGSGKRG